MEFTTQNFNNIRKDIKDALKGIEEKYEVIISPTKINYQSLEFDLVLKCVKNEEGRDVDKEKFESNCFLFDFEKEDYKLQFKLSGETFELIGFNLNKPKNNCNIRNVSTGKMYMTNDETIKRKLNRVSKTPSGYNLTETNEKGEVI